MPVLNRAADRFQRALDGERVTAPQVERLVATAQRLGDLAGAPAPDPAFVTALRERLMAEARTMPAPTPGAARAAAAKRAAARSTPVVLVLGRGTPRLVAGAALSAVLAAGVVGVASRSALPGQALYPVKGFLDGVSVRLADDDLDRGRTYLAQAQEHISDARDLTDSGDGGRASRAPATDVNVALQGAIDAVRGGQRSLDAAYTATGDPQALIAMRDFTTRALPQVDVLRDDVPAGSKAKVAELEALLLQSRDQSARRVAACGAPCQSLASSFGPASLPSSSSTSPAGSTPSARTASGVRVPGASTTSGVQVRSPSVGVGVGAGGTSAGVGGGGVSVGTGGASVGLPTVSATVPLSTSSLTVGVPLPSATLGTGGISATVPSSTLGTITLPGTSVSVPLPTLPTVP